MSFPAAPYAKQHSPWADNAGHRVDAVTMNAVEDALVLLLGAVPATNGALIWDGSKFTAAAGIKNANVDSAALIARSKLDFGSGLVNADIAAGAAISKAKLAALAIVDADVSQISPSKLASYPTDATKVLAGDGSWPAGSSFSQYQLVAELTGSGASGTLTQSTGLTGFRHFVVMWKVRSDTAAASTSLRWRANNISGGTDYLSRHSDGTSDYSAAGYLGAVPANTIAKLGTGFVFIENVSDASGEKGWHCQNQAKIGTSGTASSDLSFGQGSGHFWVNTAQAAITRLDFILGAGSFTTTSKISIYGIV